MLRVCLGIGGRSDLVVIGALCGGGGLRMVESGRLVAFWWEKCGG